MKPLYVIIITALVAVGSFFGGTEYQKSQQPQMRGLNGQIAPGQRGQFQQRIAQGTRPINGEIIAQDDTSITVKMQDGSSKIVLVADSTSINKSDQGTKTDLKTGEKVMAFGKENSDGSLTAENIQLNPADRMMRLESSPQPQQ
jgi:Domain of unknown function (DUF5666)